MHLTRPNYYVYVYVYYVFYKIKKYYFIIIIIFILLLLLFIIYYNIVCIFLVELLIQHIAEAHESTSLYTKDKLASMRRDAPATAQAEFISVLVSADQGVLSQTVYR